MLGSTGVPSGTDVANGTADPRRPGGSEFFGDPLGGLDDRRWDELAGDRFYSSAFWLRLCALEGGGRFGGVHVELPGAAPGAAVPVIGVGTDPHPNCRWDQLLSARGLPSPAPSGTLVGQLRGYLAHLLVANGVDRVPAAAAVLAAVRSTGPAMPGAAAAPVAGLAQVALYLTTPDVLAFRAAGVRSLPVALAADAWIEIPPGGWDAYLESVDSRHRSRRIRSEVRRFEQAGYRVAQHPLSEVSADVARLAFQTEQRYGRAVSVEPYLVGFRLQGEWAGDRAQVLLCHPDDGGPPVGCCLYYRDGDTIYLRAVGFDYGRLRNAAEYFNLAYYLPARLPGVRRLHAGIAAPDAKAFRGARLRPLWLLDLSAQSVLERYDDEIRGHNAAYRTGLAETSPIVADAVQTESWRAFG